MKPAPRQSESTLRAKAERAAGGLPPLLLEADHVAGAVLAGVHGRRRAGSGETFWQFRPYSQGDTVSMIDWRQSARATDRLYVRQQEWEVAASAWIWRDAASRLNYACTEEISTKRHRADVLATSLCILLASAGERIGLAGAPGRPFMGRRAAERFARALLSGEPAAGDDGLPPVPVEGEPKPYILFSDFFLPPEALAARLKLLAGARLKGHLVQIIDPSEEDYPFSGRTEFLPAALGESPLLFGDAAAVASDYRRLFRAHQTWLQEQCSHLGWSFSVHRTDQPPEPTLIALYQHLAGEAQLS